MNAEHVLPTHDVTLGDPAVLMTEPEAATLAADILVALNAAINRGSQCHTLQRFLVAHCEAHGIPLE